MPAGPEDTFDPTPILETFARAGADFVVIGGVAGGAHGSSYGTFDVDLAYSRERANLELVAKVLREIGATLRGAPENLSFQLDADALEAGGNFTFSTTLGFVDLLASPAGAPSYDQLRTGAKVIDVGGLSVHIASLDHLIAMKEAAGRPKDKLMATEYRVLSDEHRAPRDGEDNSAA